MGRGAGLSCPLQKPVATDVDPTAAQPKQVAPGEVAKATLPKMFEGEVCDRLVVHAHERQPRLGRAAPHVDHRQAPGQHGLRHRR